MKKVDNVDVLTWHCAGDCNNKMMATVFKDQQNIFYCSKCGTTYVWEWDGEAWKRKLTRIE